MVPTMNVDSNMDQSHESHVNPQTDFNQPSSSDPSGQVSMVCQLIK